MSILNGLSGVNSETLSATKVLRDNSEVIQRLNPNGTTRTVQVLPQQKHRGFIIENTGTVAAINLSVTDKDSAAVCTIGPGEWAIVHGTGTGLAGLIAGSSSSGSTLDIKGSARVATTANIADLAAGAPDPVDGISLAVGNRVLVKNQSTGAQNGIYTVTTVGTGANGVWARATDADTSAEVTTGMMVHVSEGTINADRWYTLTTNDTITLGTTALTFTLLPMLTTTESATYQVSGSSGSNLTLALDAVNAGAGEGRLTLSADDQVNIDDGTANLQFDAGVVTETGMVSIDITPSGAMVLRGGGQSDFGDDTGFFRFDGAGAQTTSGMVSGSITPSAALTLTPATSSTWSLSGSSGSNLTLTIDAVNAGAGEGRLSVNADDQININDGVLDLQLDAGVVTETGMVSIDLTPSGAMTLRGGGVSQFGDDTGYWAFDGAGALSTTGLVSASLAPSGAITLTAGASSTWGVTVNSASNFTLTLNSSNAGAGQGNLDFTVKTGITATTNPTWNFGTSQATFPGNVDATNGLDVTTAVLSAAAGLTLSAGTLSLTCSSGSSLYDNTVATGFHLFDLGTDTSATGHRIRNNSGTVLAEVLGDGQFTIPGLSVTAGGATAGTPDVLIESGDRTKNDANAGVPTSGALTLRSGTTSQTTSAATGGASGAIAVRSGATDVTVAGGTGGASGTLTLRSGDTDISAAVAATGGASGAWSGGSGAANSTGATATSGASGAVTLTSGASADANTGALTIGSGIPAATGTSGDVAISTGAPTGAGTSGAITLTTGTTSGGTRGALTATAGAITLNHTTGTFLLDNQNTTGATNIDLGADTSSVKVALRNNSGTEHFAVQGDGTFKYSTATGITAFAGGGQGSATQLTMRYNEITVCATTGDSVKLPAAVAGLLVTVKNNGNTAADVFPGTSDSINTLAADAAIRLAQGCSMTFHAVDATVWEVQSRTVIDHIAVAAGTAHTGSTDEAVLASRTIQASRLTTGTKVRVSWGARVTADAGATTLTGRLRLGATTLTGTELCVTAALDTSAGHYFSGEFEFVARAVPGGTVAITGWGHTYLGAVGASGAAAVSQALPPTNFATNAALLLEVTGDWSAADANSVQIEYFDVSFPNA